MGAKESLYRQHIRSVGQMLTGQMLTRTNVVRTNATRTNAHRKSVAPGHLLIYPPSPTLSDRHTNIHTFHKDMRKEQEPVWLVFHTHTHMHAHAHIHISCFCLFQMLLNIITDLRSVTLLTPTSMH